MKYKALMLDVDGTLVINHRDGLPTERVRKAIEKAKRVMHVGVATGRPLRQVDHLLSLLQLSGPCIINGSTQIVDAGTKKILKQTHILATDIFPVLAITKKLQIAVYIVEQDDDIEYYEGYHIRNPYGLFTFPIDESLADRFIDEISHIPTIGARKTSSWKPYHVHVEVNHVLATKQQGILEIAKILGISTDEIIGVGDHYNDFPLLTACGLKVAMGNAVDDLKAIADYIAPSVEDDGVADVIEKFVLQ